VTGNPPELIAVWQMLELLDRRAPLYSPLMGPSAMALRRAGDRRTYDAWSLRDTFESGKPIWLTETADAACGGNPWASTFLDSFRYLDQLGRMSKRGRLRGARPVEQRRSSGEGVRKP
jgi:hypothetical protein